MGLEGLLGRPGNRYAQFVVSLCFRRGRMCVGGSGPLQACHLLPSRTLAERIFHNLVLPLGKTWCSFVFMSDAGFCGLQSVFARLLQYGLEAVGAVI